MRVLVNAPSVEEGGSLVVLEYLLESMARLRPDIDWALAAHKSLRFSRNPPENLVRLDIGDIDRGGVGVPRWYEQGLPSAVVRLRVNVVFSMTNYLPIRRLPCPTVLLVQHAGHFSDVFDRLTRLHLRRADRIALWRLKTLWVQRSVRMATEVTVQTAALADAIATRTGCSRAKISRHPARTWDRRRTKSATAKCERPASADRIHREMGRAEELRNIVRGNRALDRGGA